LHTTSRPSSETASPELASRKLVGPGQFSSPEAEPRQLFVFIPSRVTWGEWRNSK